jgi:hypothetical protein
MTDRDDLPGRSPLPGSRPPGRGAFQALIASRSRLGWGCPGAICQRSEGELLRELHSGPISRSDRSGTKWGRAQLRAKQWVRWKCGEVRFLLSAILGIIVTTNCVCRDSSGECPPAMAKVQNVLYIEPTSRGFGPAADRLSVPLCNKVRTVKSAVSQTPVPQLLFQFRGMSRAERGTRRTSGEFCLLSR